MRVYSAAEVCEMLDISKSTLFRWEQDGVLPPVRRDLSGQRQYTQEHIRVISQRQMEQLSRRLRHALEVESKEDLEEISPAISMYKFLAGNILGLQELAEYPRTPPQIIRRLLQIALENYEPGEKTFSEIIKVVKEQNDKLDQTNTQAEE